MYREMHFSNYADVKEHLKDSVPDFLANKQKLSFKDLDEGTQDAIINDARGCFKMTRKEVLSIMKYCEYEVCESDDLENFPIRVSYSFLIDEDVAIKMERRLPLEYREILEDEQVTIESMDFITSEVEKYNLKLKKLLDSTIKDGVRSWRNLNTKLVSAIIKTYNDSAVDLKSGKIIHI